MAYPITAIEGIGPVSAEKLEAAGIKTTEALLERCGPKSGRAALARETDLPEKKILTWTNHADLMRLKGVGGEFAELLEASGVDTVKALVRRNADNLAARMASVNEEKKLTRAVPNARQISSWIDAAGEMAPGVTH